MSESKSKRDVIARRVREKPLKLSISKLVEVELTLLTVLIDTNNNEKYWNWSLIEKKGYWSSEFIGQNWKLFFQKTSGVGHCWLRGTTRLCHIQNNTLHACFLGLCLYLILKFNYSPRWILSFWVFCSRCVWLFQVWLAVRCIWLVKQLISLGILCESFFVLWGGQLIMRSMNHKVKRC